jgi:hypothetical protein
MYRELTVMVLAHIQTKYGPDHMGIVLFIHLIHFYLFTGAWGGVVVKALRY